MQINKNAVNRSKSPTTFVHFNITKPRKTSFKAWLQQVKLLMKNYGSEIVKAVENLERSITVNITLIRKERIEESFDYIITFIYKFQLLNQQITSTEATVVFYLYVLLLCIHLYLITVLLHACTCQKRQNKDVQLINQSTFAHQAVNQYLIAVYCKCVWQDVIVPYMVDVEYFKIRLKLSVSYISH